MTVQLSWTDVWGVRDGCIGVPLSLDSAESVTLTTAGLTMDILDVKSALARDATDGRWGPFGGLDDDILPEVPPDGLPFVFTEKISHDCFAMQVL